MNLEVLEAIGLTKAEIKVYLALLELGSSTTGPIVDASGASSSKMYEILERLIHKGLVSSVIKSGTKHFEAADPKRLLDYLNEKKRSLNEQATHIESLIPELELKRSLSKDRSEVLVFKGLKGAQTAFDDLLKLKKGEEITVMGFSDVDEPFKRFLIAWHEKRAKLGITTRAIFGAQLYDLLSALQDLPHTKVKAHPMQTENPVAVLTYADKTLFSLPKDQIWIQIRNARLTQANRARFEEAWKQEITIYRGFDEVTKRFDSLLETLSEGDEYYVLGASMSQAGTQMRDWLLRFHTHRIKMKVRAKFLTIPQTSEFIHYELTHTGDPKMTLSEVKALPQEYSSPMQINLFKDNRVFMFLQFKEPVFFEIQSELLHTTFKKQFEALWNQDTRTLKGVDAVQLVFEEILAAGHCDFMGARGYLFDARPEYTKKWTQRAIKQGFTMRNVVDEKIKGHAITKLPFAETRYNIPAEFSPLSVFWIYSDKVAISNWTEKEPVVTIIENKHLHDLYKKQFETMWTHKMVLAKK